MNDKIKAEIEARISAFAADVTEVLQRAVADAVADALSGSRGGKRGRPARVASVANESILRELKKKPGQRIEELARAMSVPTKAIARPLKEMLETKDVKKSGVARGTRYRAA